MGALTTVSTVGVGARVASAGVRVGSGGATCAGVGRAVRTGSAVGAGVTVGTARLLPLIDHTPAPPIKKQDATTETPIMSWLRDCMKHPDVAANYKCYSRILVVWSVHACRFRNDCAPCPITPRHAGTCRTLLHHGGTVGWVHLNPGDSVRGRLIGEAILVDLGNACHNVPRRVDCARPDQTMTRVSPGTSTPQQSGPLRSRPALSSRTADGGRGRSCAHDHASAARWVTIPG